MSLRAAYVMDTTAVLNYGEHLALGQLLAGLAADEESLIVPVLCLAEAYRTAGGDERIHLLDVLGAQPTVRITPVNNDDGPILGGWSGVLGSFDLAHAVLETATHHVPLITSRRKEVVRILPEEWPVMEI